MDLKDYTGDGKALDSLFAAGDCNLLLIQLVGYSQKQDRVIQYPVSLKNWDVDDRGKITTGFWLDRVFLQNPIRQASGIIRCQSGSAISRRTKFTTMPLKSAF